VTPGAVRKQWSAIESFLRDYARTLGIGFAVLIAIALGASSWRWRDDRPADFHDLADVEPRRILPPAPTSDQLRRRAQKACDAEAWQACLDDLDAANAIDPLGETAGMQGMRDRARSHLVPLELPKKDDKP
jgi:hypothetical protein